jgi:RNA polymerase sigma factor (sigma-70 family)
VPVTSSTADLEELLIANLEAIEKIVTIECRHRHMTEADRDDFSSHVKLKLIENDYAALRAFQGRSRMTTYLSVVIHRLLSDYQNHLRGKWHPSAQALKLGPVAVRVETLLIRDGKSLDETCSLLASDSPPASRAEVTALAAQIPSRGPKRRSVLPEDVESELSIPPDSVETAAAHDQRRQLRHRTTTAMQEALARLDSEAQLLIRLHFKGELTLADISRNLGVPQKPLYRRLQQIYAELRRRLLAAGLKQAEIADLIGRADSDFDFGMASAWRVGRGRRARG